MTTPPVSRVLFVTHACEIGGAEAALLRLIDAFEADPGGFALAVATFADGPLAAALRARGVETVVLDAGATAALTRYDAAGRSAWRSARRVLGPARALRRLLAERDPQLVVANSLKSAVFVAAAAFPRRRWVWHLHDRLAADYLPRFAVTALRMLTRVGPWAVLANSRATAATARSRRIVVAYPGIPADWFSDRAGGGSATAVGIVGRISSTKGQAEFLDAVEALGARDGAVFRIVGAALFDDGDVEADLRRRAAETPALRAVEWTGWVADTRAELRRLRVLVHASPVPEPFGQVVVEAMASGVAVIATDAGGIPEIVDPTGSATTVADGVRVSDRGVLVRAGDPAALARAIDWMLQHPAHVDALARTARTGADRFRIEATRGAVAETWRAALR